MVPNEIKVYLRGGYGQAPAPVDPEIRHLILGDEPAAKSPDISAMPPVYEESKIEMEVKLGREATEEEVISYIMNPQQAIIEKKQEEPKVIPPSKTDGPVEFEMIIQGGM